MVRLSSTHDISRLFFTRRHYLSLLLALLFTEAAAFCADETNSSCIQAQIPPSLGQEAKRLAEAISVKKNSSSEFSHAEIPKESSISEILASVQSEPPTESDRSKASTGSRDVISDMEDGQSVINVDKEIEKELLEFARFNIAYFKTTSGVLSKRVYGYAFAREAGTAVAFAGTLTELSERARVLNDVGKFSKSARRHALICSSIGNAISAESSTLELGQNLWAVFYARRKNCSSTQAVSNVAQRVERIDKLLDKREQILARQTDPSVRELGVIEGKLLQRVKQQLLYEFRKWNVSSREQAAKENFFYTLDAMQNYLGMGSNLLSLRSFHSPGKSAAAAITLLIANSAATLNPLLSNLTAYMVRVHERHLLFKKFNVERPLAERTLSVAELEKVEKNEHNSKMLEEALFICKSSEKMDQNIDFEVSEIARLRQIAQQQAIAGPLIGLTSVARAILTTVSYYGYGRDRVTSNKLLFAGRISQATGQAYALWDTPYTLYKGYRRRKILAAEGRLPSQVLERRLKRLDDIEERLKTPSQ